MCVRYPNSLDNKQHVVCWCCCCCCLLLLFTSLHFTLLGGCLREVHPGHDGQQQAQDGHGREAAALGLLLLRFALRGGGGARALLLGAPVTLQHQAGAS